MKVMKIKILLTALTLGIFTSCEDSFVSPPSPSGTSILDLLDSNDQFDLLTASLNKTGLGGLLDNVNAGQFTLFAPNDAAMLAFLQSSNAFNNGSLDEAGALTAIAAMTNTTPSSSWNIPAFATRLNYHIISSEVKANQITGAKTFTTLSTPSAAAGQARISASVVGTEVWINANVATNGAKVISTDIDASNGVVHTIDKVLAAVTALNTLASLGYTSSNTVPPINYGTTPPTINGGNTPDATGTDYDLFAIALRKTGLIFTLMPNSTPAPDFTIFAPRDSFFQSFLSTIDAGVTSEATAQTFINNLGTSTTPTLAAFTDIIKYHIVNGRTLSSDIVNDADITPILNTEKFKINGAVITAEASTANIVATNILSNGGVIHGIDAVLKYN